MIRALTFDVTGTLIHSPRLGSLYAEVLGRHGIEVDPKEAGRLVREVWQELACLAEPGRDRFTAHPDGPRGWWKRFLERFCELFHRFATAEAWEVYPEVPDVLTQLQAAGLRLGVVSNWDPRLPDLLERLDLARFFDVIVYSSAVGVEKPDRRIFLHAASRLRVPPGGALHIGDGRLEDVEGALGAGLRALHLDRTRGNGDLRDLSRLPVLLSAGRIETRPGLC
jgi:putative hydrolase of the HAD superfamily